MGPSQQEIDEAIREEGEAMKEFARLSSLQTNTTVKIKAIRNRLMLARSHKRALTNDMMSYSKV